MNLKKSSQTIEKLVRVALGEQQPDTVIVGGKIVNVYSGHISVGDVELVDGWIASINVSGRSDYDAVNTRIIDASNNYLVPGLIDAHCHPDILYNPFSFAKAVLPLGTTTIFSNAWDIPMAYNPEDYLRLAEDMAQLPLKIFSSLPAMALFLNTEWTYDVIKSFLNKDYIFGVAELALWKQMLELNEETIDKIGHIIDAEKTIEGHTAGCTDRELDGLACMGIGSCHEAITAREALKRLERGLWVMLRHSTLRSDLPELSKLLTKHKIMSNRIMLTPDGITPDEIVGKGYMDEIIREAVSNGIDPVQAIKMATINPAMYYRVDNYVGGIPPGRKADIILTESLDEFYPKHVIANGVTVGKGGKLIFEIPYSKVLDKATSYPELHTIIDEDTFRIPANVRNAQDVVGIHLISNVITKRVNLRLHERNGELLPDIENDVIRAALIDVRGETITHAFVKGFGARIGGLAATIATYNDLVLFGYDKIDLAIAAKEVLRIGGGVVIVENEKIIYTLALTIGGKASREPMEIVAKQYKQLKELLKEKGFLWNDIYFCLNFINNEILPEIRLTAKGVILTKIKEIISPPRRL